jgi:hypothetical protein
MRDEPKSSSKNLRLLKNIPLRELNKGRNYEELAKLALFLGRAATLTVASASTLLRSCVELSAKYSIETVQTLITESKQDGSAQRRVIDMVRGYFRELGELQERASREAQEELDDLARNVVLRAENQDGRPYRRRWRAKS